MNCHLFIFSVILFYFHFFKYQLFFVISYSHVRKDTNVHVFLCAWHFKELEKDDHVQGAKG
jgi:hypothetical protein